MQKTEILRMAQDIEEAAKNEEVRFIRFFDLTGRMREAHRYQLPYIAEGLRRAAAEMIE